MFFLVGPLRASLHLESKQRQPGVELTSWISHSAFTLTRWSIVLDQWERKSTPIHCKGYARLGLCCSLSWFNIDNDDNESGWIAIWDMQVPRVCGQCGYNSGAQAWIWPQGSLTACILLPFIPNNAVLSSGKTIYFLFSRLVFCDYCVT